MKETYDDGPLAPAPIPMSTNKAHPIPLPPDPLPYRDLRIQLDAHLKIALKLRHWNRVRVTHLSATLEAAIDHGVEVSFLGRLGRCGLYGGAVDSFMEDGVVGVVLFHGAEVIGALEEMLALAGGVLRAHRLAIDALRGETLRGAALLVFGL